MSSVLVTKLKSYYSKYLGKKSIEEYLVESRKSKIGDEEKVTDSLFEWLLKDKDLWNYSDNNVLLQQQHHKAIIQGKKVILKPDFETNNEFCKISILFDAKASNIPYSEMISGSDTVYESTFKRYLVNIRPVAKYILGFNLEYFILYARNGERDIQVLAPIDVKKLFQEDVVEIERFKKLLELTKFEELNNLEKIRKLVDKRLEKESIFNIDLFVKKFKHTQNGLYSFFLQRLEQIGINAIPEEIQEELLEFRDNEKSFFIQLANRLTLIEFFKYIFIRTYEDFQLIHKIDEQTTIPVTFGETIGKIQYANLDEFRQKYIGAINKISFKDIGEEFFQGFSTLFNKYENFITDYILTGDSIEEEFDKEYYNRLFDILFFLNEFYFGGLEAEGDDIIGRLYETSLERADRKKFGQFYTPRYIIDFILDELHIVPGENKKILDLSCGTGGFLMKYLSKINGNILMQEDETHLKNIFQGTYGIDIKMFSTLLTKLNLALIFIIKNKFLIERKLGTHRLDTKNIITGDGLEINKEESKKLEKGTFDYVVGNPPYVGIKGNADIVSRVKIDNNLSQYFTKRPDLYYFFIIHGIEKLKVGGKLGYIFPREWMTADFANKLRGYILDHTKIIKLIDLNGISIFEDAGTTSCLLFLEKVSEKIEGQTFDFIQFHNYEEMNVIKFIDDKSELLQKSTTSEHGGKNQRVLSGFEVFSQKIIRPENFDRIIAKVKKNEKYDISLLGGFTTGKVYLNDFIDVKTIEQDILSESPWILGSILPESYNLTTIDSLLKISQGIVTGADSVTKGHIEKGLVKDNTLGRGIFVLEEGKEIRGAGLHDIKSKNDYIGKIEINLYENGSWTELYENEKQIIKPLFSGVCLQKWDISTNNLWIIYCFFDTLKEYHDKNFDEDFIKTNFSNIFSYISQFFNVLKARKGANFKPYTRKGNYLAFSNPVNVVPFSAEKIIISSKVLGFTYTEKTAYGNGGGQGGLNYIFIDEKNKYTKLINSNSSKKDYLKFINAMLNSSVVLSYLRKNKFNSLSGEKLKELKIPKINFEDPEQVNRYNKVVELADMLIDLYAQSARRIVDIVLTKTGREAVNNDEYRQVMNSRDFEIIDDVLFVIKIGEVEYFGFDNYKETVQKAKEQGETLGEALGFDNSDVEKQIQKINAEIDALAEWFYFENKSVPSDYKEEVQRDIFTP